MVELVAAGRTPAELAREFGCSAQTIINWAASSGVKVGAPRAAPAAALSGAEREELARLRRENRRLQMERDILAKATAWFAAKSDKTFTPSTSS
jgi:transposase